MGKVECLFFCRRNLLTRMPCWLDAEQRLNPKIHQRSEGKQKYVWPLALPFLKPKQIMRLCCAAADHRKSSQKMRQLFREAAPVEQCGTQASLRCTISATDILFPERCKQDAFFSKSRVFFQMPCFFRSPVHVATHSGLS